MTRPKPQADRFALELESALGDAIDVTVAPVTQIVLLPNTLDLTNVHTLLFTSSAGVEAFAAQSDRRDIRCICVGSRTTEIARDLGFVAVSADGDARALVDLAMKRAPSEGIFLHVGGLQTAGDVAGLLSSQGACAKHIALYEQKCVPLNQRALSLLKTNDEVIVPLLSPLGVENFLPQVAISDLASHIAVCLSQNIANKLNASDWSRVVVSSRPNSAALIDRIRNLI